MNDNPLQNTDVEEIVDVQTPAKVVLFNDDIHTFEEVIGQLIKALRCDRFKAEALTLVVHNTGRAIVYSGEIPRCIEVSGVLEEIELSTQIEY